MARPLRAARGEIDNDELLVESEYRGLTHVVDWLDENGGAPAPAAPTARHTTRLRQRGLPMHLPTCAKLLSRLAHWSLTWSRYDAHWCPAGLGPKFMSALDGFGAAAPVICAGRERHQWPGADARALPLVSQVGARRPRLPRPRAARQVSLSLLRASRASTA